MSRLGAGAGAAYPGQRLAAGCSDSAAYVRDWLEADGLVPVLATIEAYCRQCKDDAVAAQDAPLAALWGFREGVLFQLQRLLGGSPPAGEVPGG